MKHWWIAAALLLWPAPGAEAATVSVTKYSYYTINGLTPGAIYSALLKRGPRIQGAKALAFTSANAEQDGTMTQDAGSCRISDYSIKFKFVVNLPRLANEARLPANDRLLWRQFSVFLKAHELHHTELWLGCAAELDRKVQAVRASTCEAVSRKTNDLWAGMLKTCEARQNAFDDQQRSPLLAHPFMRKVLRGG